jgi:transcriptional regulator with XRE-family HTH domain
MPTHIKRLRACYGHAGINQELLAAKLGWSRDKLLRVEKGYRAPSPADAAALAKALKCAVADLGVTVQA